MIVFNRISAQITALLALAIVIVVPLVGALVVMLTPEWRLPLPESLVRVGVVLRGLNAMPREAREQLAAAYRADNLSVTLHGVGDVPPAATTPPSAMRLYSVDFGPGVRLLSVERGESDRAIVVAQLSDGQPVTLVTDKSEGRALPLPFILLVGFLIVSTALLSIWAARRLVSPLARFAAAVDRFGTLGEDAPLLEEGPVEIRRASSAFNRMRERISRLVEDRTKTLMAISHDLRTPLTRLRLRIEELSDGDGKRRMLEDVNLMDDSIASAVTFLREGVNRETIEMADLPSLIGTICDHFADAGHGIDYDGPAHLAFGCRPLALSRAITNLVDNATRFGSSVVVRLDPVDDGVRVDVEDDGPGIPDAEKDRVLEPFYRADRARQRGGSFGLGLAIVKDVVAAHGGRLTMEDRAPHGLRARLYLPVHTPQKR